MISKQHGIADQASEVPSLGVQIQLLDTRLSEQCCEKHRRLAETSEVLATDRSAVEAQLGTCNKVGANTISALRVRVFALRRLVLARTAKLAENRVEIGSEAADLCARRQRLTVAENELVASRTWLNERRRRPDGGPAVLAQRPGKAGERRNRLLYDAVRQAQAGTAELDYNGEPTDVSEIVELLQQGADPSAEVGPVEGCSARTALIAMRQRDTVQLARLFAVTQDSILGLPLPADGDFSAAFSAGAERGGVHRCLDCKSYTTWSDVSLMEHCRVHEALFYVGLLIELIATKCLGKKPPIPLWAAGFRGTSGGPVVVRSVDEQVSAINYNLCTVFLADGINVMRFKRSVAYFNTISCLAMWISPLTNPELGTGRPFPLNTGDTKLAGSVTDVLSILEAIDDDFVIVN